MGTMKFSLKKSWFSLSRTGLLHFFKAAIYSNKLINKIKNTRPWTDVPFSWHEIGSQKLSLFFRQTIFSNFVSIIFLPYIRANMTKYDLSWKKSPYQEKLSLISRNTNLHTNHTEKKITLSFKKYMHTKTDILRPYH